MLCTINTDASFHPEYKVGAFAFWSVCDQFRIQKAGFLRDFVKNPDEAEIKCIINALKVTLNSDKTISKIIINTDSLNAKAVFENDKKHVQKYGLKKWRRLEKMFSNLVKKHNVSYEIRHVKAHTGDDNARSYVNEWCDKNAKYYLWKRINQLKKKGYNFN